LLTQPLIHFIHLSQLFLKFLSLGKKFLLILHFDIGYFIFVCLVNVTIKQLFSVVWNRVKSMYGINIIKTCGIRIIIIKT